VVNGLVGGSGGGGRELCTAGGVRGECGGRRVGDERRGRGGRRGGGDWIRAKEWILA